MAKEHPTSDQVKLFLSQVGEIQLTDAAKHFTSPFIQSFPPTFALLYAPQKCYLAVVDKGGKFHDPNGEVETRTVFEARVFNETAELRWLNRADGKGVAVVLCDNASLEFFGNKPELLETKVREEQKQLVGMIAQTYLLWGQSSGASDKGWTEFAEARIGSFYVPLSDVVQEGQRAQLTAVEYLGEYEDGNVAVCQERLTGIEVAPMKENDNG